MRLCISCTVEKDETEFYVRKDGQVVNVCKSCQRSKSRERARSNNDYYKEKGREFRERNPNYYKDYAIDNNVKDKYKETFKRSSRQYYRNNKAKCLERSKNYRKSLTLSQKRYYKHRITDLEYETMLNQQNKCCGICKTPFSDNFSSRVNIDHDHSTGEIRGLLCHRCNTGLGLFRDNVGHLKNAIEYLKKLPAY